MLYYPKIPGSRSALLTPCIAFEKLDGTNLHWDWHRDFGWHAFGLPGTANRSRGVRRKIFTGQFAEDVRKGNYRVTEGVVCKGGKTPDDLWMAKIKTYDYMARLKQAFADRWEEYWE